VALLGTTLVRRCLKKTCMRGVASATGHMPAKSVVVADEPPAA